MPDRSIDSLLAEVEWLLADDRWTEEEFTRIWRAGLAAAGNDGAALQGLLAHADHSWLARVLPPGRGARGVLPEAQALPVFGPTS